MAYMRGDMESLPIDSIKVGDRCRKDLGDVKALADSIADVGLLHPVVVTSEGKLVAGERRLAAARLLGWNAVPVTVAQNLTEAAGLLRAERDENTCRKELVPTEMVTVGKRLEEVYRPEAEARKEATQAKPGEGRVGGGKLPGPKAETRDQVGSAVGVSGRTYEKAKRVVDAAEEDPTLGPLVEEMDRTGKVDGPYRKLRAKQDETKTLLVTPPTGKFRTIVVDPPWDHEGFSLAGRGAPTYAVMSREELLALPVPEWSDEECHLYLWTTNNFLLRAGELLVAWGFDFKTVLTWVKPRIGLGSYFRSSTEHVLFGTRGGLSTRATDIPTHFEAPTGEHSEKPDLFFALAERASYPPYFEAFARKRRDGWEVWGNLD